MFSLAKIDLAALTFRTLIDRIAERIADLPSPPRLLAYGESLGAGRRSTVFRSNRTWSTSRPHGCARSMPRCS